jgi:site-specific recombinase XerD
MRGVFERPAGSGVWWINFHCSSCPLHPAGGRHRERVGRRAAAEEAYLQRRLEIREGKFSPPKASGLTFRQAADETIANKRTRNRASSCRVDVYLAGRIGQDLGDVRLAALTAGAIEDYLQKQREAGLTGSTVNRYRSFISSVFAYCIRQGKLAVNPCAQVPRGRENPFRDRFLSELEESALRKAIREFFPEHLAEVDLALYTGIRRGEQFLLRREDVDLERGILKIPDEEGRKTGRRAVPLNAAARQALEAILAGAAGDYLFAKHEGQRDWRRWFEFCVKAAAIQNFTWHDLRHTFASRLVMAGVDLRTVQELLGHKTYQMTLRYAHLAPSHTAAAVEKLCKPAKLEIVRKKRGA